MTTKGISRRNFIKLSGLTGTALALGYYAPALGKGGKVITLDAAKNLGLELNAFVFIDTAGKITLINHRAEMGQGSYQAVPSILAEELEVNLDDVNIIFGPGNEEKYGSQITGGSSTVRGAYKRLGQIGASAREMLIQAAAKKWNVAKSECYAENGKVIHKPSGKKFAYGELVEEAAKLEPPKDVALKEIKSYKILRKSLPRQDTPMKTNGQATFGLDFKFPGMLYAVVERNPRFIGKVISFDDSKAKAVPGVKHVFKVQRDVFDHMRDGVAVVADSLWAAMEGRKALTVEWDNTGFEHYNTEQLYEKLRQNIDGKALTAKTKGDFNSTFSESKQKVESVYETPYESHSCMEPLNCVAHVQDGKCEIWGPIQAPGWVQGNLSKHLNLPMEKVVVNMTFLGGGFGRKAFTDYPSEAALISKEVKAPVKVVWTREDDTTLGPFRPGMIYNCKAALSESGEIQAFETRMSGQNMGHQNPGSDLAKPNNSITEGFLDGYLETLPNYNFADIPLDTSPIPVMWWRSVYSSTNGFAYESFMDELAAKAGMDPIEFRRKHVKEDRYHKVLDKLEEVSGWKSKGKNEGWGIAITECFKSIVAEAVKVSKDAKGGVKIDKVYAVMDCGWYVNPDIIKAQIEGSIVMALGAAVVHETNFKDGMAVEKNFNTYRMPRITDTPEIEMHIMENNEEAGGVGEPALPPFAPALCNAIYDLTGTRIKKLPFDLKRI